MTLLHPTYFSPIVQYAAIVQADEVQFEMMDNFQKQTYRTRCYMYGANGKQLLNVPIKHDKSKERLLTKDVQIDNSEHWQKLHLKSLQNAYRSSPFFEFYEDDLFPIFEKNYTFLMDLNLETFEFVMDALQEPLSYATTTEYFKIPENTKDLRTLAIAKQKLNIEFPEYVQVFDDKHGFIPNLSILDLLFMEGPNTISYLEKLKIVV